MEGLTVELRRAVKPVRTLPGKNCTKLHTFSPRSRASYSSDLLEGGVTAALETARRTLGQYRTSYAVSDQALGSRTYRGAFHR
jgi:hypothetical protein